MRFRPIYPPWAARAGCSVMLVPKSTQSALARSSWAGARPRLLSSGRQWYLILLARWICHWSRGTGCLGLMPSMMSCRGQGAPVGRGQVWYETSMRRAGGGTHSSKRPGSRGWECEGHPGCATSLEVCLMAGTCSRCCPTQTAAAPTPPPPNPPPSQCAGLPAGRPCHPSRRARAPAQQPQRCGSG